MAYPPEMQESLKRVEASRNSRLGGNFPKLTLAEKAAVLETYHPDFRADEKREIRVGPNKGGIAPRELVDLLEVGTPEPFGSRGH